jgi:hypothetical protein
MFVPGRYSATISMAAAAALLLPVLTGCGGGKEKEAAVVTGSEDGFLRTVKINPPPGSSFISKQTKFYLSWEDGDTPPPSFTAVLVRYTEPDDSDITDNTTEQRTQVIRQGTQNIWEVSRTDGFDLDRGGVYYLQLKSGQVEVLAAYIVRSDGRSTLLSRDQDTENADTGTQGAYRHLVVTR